MRLILGIQFLIFGKFRTLMILSFSNLITSILSALKITLISDKFLRISFILDFKIGEFYFAKLKKRHPQTEQVEHVFPIYSLNR